jgi:hypothetical protein
VPRLKQYAHNAVRALVCAAAILAAGCHHTTNISGYGIAWVTLTDEPGDYASYVVTIDSVTLTRSDGAIVTAVGTPEVVDLVQLRDISELWSSGAIPTGIYTSATITVDYTNAAIAVIVGGLPRKATVLDSATGAAPTTFAITVDFDPQHQLNITPTFASTSAALIALDFNLAASGRVSLGDIPVVYVRPFMTVGYLPDDTKLIRIRGPLINSSIDVNSYTVYVRPFYDEANNIGSVSMFSQPTTVYTINGKSYVGGAGLDTLSILSAGTTMTAGFTTFQPDFNPLNSAVAGRFNLVYVIGGSTLEDQYTEGISGDVIQRSGNILTLLGSTLFLNTADTFAYQVQNAQVLLGPGTIVTADDNTTLTGLNSDSIAVGQHITARGLYSILADGSTQIDSTGTQSTNDGSVRLQSTELWGSLVSSAARSVVMNLTTINDWPVSDYNFDGNGATAAQKPTPAAFSVTTTGLALPVDTVANDPVWVDGFSTPFGSAPPDFTAVALNNESSVQVAGGQLGGGAPLTPGIGQCGIGSQVCNPAVLQVIWNGPTGSVSPFETHSASGFSINLSDPKLYSAVIRIGPEVIALESLPASPLIAPTVVAANQTFAPRYAWGNPLSATTTASVTSSTAISVSGNFGTFIDGVTGAIDAANPALQLAATGIFNRTTNTFTATSINFVL